MLQLEVLRTTGSIGVGKLTSSTSTSTSALSFKAGMSSRQPTATEASQAELEEDEVISGTGEGDEIMEEPEEQEDGYSESLCFTGARSYLASSLYTPSKIVPLILDALQHHPHQLLHSLGSVGSVLCLDMNTSAKLQRTSSRMTSTSLD